MPKTQTYEYVKELERLLRSAGNDGDVRVVGSWIHELKKAELRSQAFKNPALGDVWRLMLSERDAMNAILLNTEKLSEAERFSIFKYRNLLESIHNLFAGAGAKAEALEERIEREAKAVGATA